MVVAREASTTEDGGSVLKRIHLSGTRVSPYHYSHSLSQFLNPLMYKTIIARCKETHPE